jgi:polysaccharide export outer membrane protein
MMLDPHVNILTQSYGTPGVNVLGEVTRPGLYYLLGKHSLEDALAAAGGVSQGEGATITLTHRDDPDHPIILRVNSPALAETEQTTQVYPGDSVQVSRADLLYVVGDVRLPGQIAILRGQNPTVLNALALSQGVNPTASLAKATILRKTPTGVISIPLNLNKIMKNQEPNPTLEAADVLVVPRSEGKVLLQTIVPAAATSAISAASTAIIIK